MRFAFILVLNPCLCGSVIRAANLIIRAAWTALHDGHIFNLRPQVSHSVAGCVCGFEKNGDLILFYFDMIL